MEKLRSKNSFCYCHTIKMFQKLISKFRTGSSKNDETVLYIMLRNMETLYYFHKFNVLVYFLKNVFLFPKRLLPNFCWSPIHHFIQIHQSSLPLTWAFKTFFKKTKQNKTKQNKTNLIFVLKRSKNYILLPISKQKKKSKFVYFNRSPRRRTSFDVDLSSQINLFSCQVRSNRCFPSPHILLINFDYIKLNYRLYCM